MLLCHKQHIFKCFNLKQDLPMLSFNTLRDRADMIRLHVQLAVPKFSWRTNIISILPVLNNRVSCVYVFETA